MKTNVIISVIITSVFIISSFIPSQIVYSEEEGYMGIDGCGECHKNEKKLVDGHIHAKLKHTCEECHGPGQAHADIGAKKLNALKKKKGDLKIIATNKSELCGECHKSMFNELSLNKHAKFRVTCVACHSPHASVKTEKGIQRKCLDCHKGKYKIEIKIAAMSDLSCETCHMPAPEKGGIPHIFGISADPDYRLRDSSKKLVVNDEGFARLTVDMICATCHKSDGKAHEMQRKEMLARAKKIH